MLNDMVDSFHTQPIATVDERGPPLPLLDKVSKKVRLVWKVQKLNTSFRNDTAIVGLYYISK